MSSAPAIGQRRELLARAEWLVTRRRRAEVDDLLTLLGWADSHDGDPQAVPDPISVGHGGPRLVAVGGDGTPQVVDLCFAEMAIARQAGEVATRNLTADALDLRHRLPRLWAQVQDLACETWVARKIARMSRPLSRDAVKVVDQAVADAVGQSPCRLLTIAEAKVVEADQAAPAARVEENRRAKGVWLPKPAPGQAIDDVDNTAGVRSVFGRRDEADAIELEQTIDDLADSLGLLARPADALALMAATARRGRRVRRAGTIEAGWMGLTGGWSSRPDRSHPQRGLGPPTLRDGGGRRGWWCT